MLVGQASVTGLLEAGLGSLTLKSHAVTGEDGSPREAEAQLPEERAVWQEGSGQTRGVRTEPHCPRA